MPTPSPPLTLIVAATVKNGIGKNGGLPWPMLKKEMAYFARITIRVPSQSNGHAASNASKPSPQNVVIMGRKTWESIPLKFRPLRDRTNVVISSRSSESFDQNHPEVLIAPSIESVLATLQARSQDGSARPVGKVFVIGGSSIYDTALKLPNARHVLLTRIYSDYDCDTHFPVDLDADAARQEGWRQRTHQELQDFVGEQLEDTEVEERVDDAAVRYRFTLYER